MMLCPLIFGVLYLFLSAKVTGLLVLDASAAHSRIRMSLYMWGMQLCVLDQPILGGKKRKSAEKERARRRRKTIRTVLRAVRWGRTDVRLRIGTGDAAQTAAVTGGIYAVSSSLETLSGRRFPIRLQVIPDFRKPCFVLFGRCIFSLVPGDIILAALFDAVKKNGRGDSSGEASN